MAEPAAAQHEPQHAPAHDHPAAAPGPAPAPAAPAPAHAGPPPLRLVDGPPPAASGEVPPSVADALGAPGEPLPEAVRAPLQKSLGVDVSDVRAGRKPGTRVMSVRAGTCGIHTLLLERTQRV